MTTDPDVLVITPVMRVLVAMIGAGSAIAAYGASGSAIAGVAAGIAIMAWPDLIAYLSREAKARREQDYTTGKELIDEYDT